MRTRKNVHTLKSNDRSLYWYGRAIEVMKTRPRTDPLSWDYQAAVHGIASVPSAQRRFWAQCQHGSAFFLPWHRMYLLRFERIVAAEVAEMNGPLDWALPYWDYSTNPAHRALPPAFRNATDPTGKPNPLFVARRASGANAGQHVLSAADVDLTRCLRAPGTTSPGGFFGHLAVAHFGVSAGALELTPHNAVHRAVGRGGGLMQDPDLAALDPIFWLHHANIDRLWEVWLARDPAHQHLASPYWRSGVGFDFYDENRAVVTMTTEDVLNLADPAVDYDYEDISDPLASSPPTAVVASTPGPRPGGGGPSVSSPIEGELAGATLAAVELDTSVSHVDVPTPVAAAAASSVAASVPSRSRIVLVLEHVRSGAVAPTYDVYVNVPAPDDPTDHEERFVGRAAMFGIAQASDPSGQHAGSGQTFAFDITDLYRLLEGEGDLDPASLRVSFVPIEPDQGTKVSVGRIGIYFQ